MNILRIHILTKISTNHLDDDDDDGDNDDDDDKTNKK
jgi:hypothetical protein